MSNFLDKYVACPFYFKQEGRKIYCDGFEQGVRIHLSFGNKILMNKHKSQYCHSVKGCEKCPIYPVIEKRYKPLDEEKLKI
ncbi:MAG: hypothetical protein J6K63_09000 [Clostridia bacterium]|nr:hypothetical protein [Clostridia bacterium]